MTRQYVGRYLQMSDSQLATLECGDADADTEIVRGYVDALSHLQQNSLSNKTTGHIKWTVPSPNSSEDKWWKNLAKVAGGQ